VLVAGLSLMSRVPGDGHRRPRAAAEA